MEDTYSNGKKTTEVNYHGNKDIKLIKRGRPPKKKESPVVTPQIKSEKEIWEEWVKANRVEFMNSGKKSNEFITNVYKAYNAIFDSNKSRGKCGICDWNIILDLKRRYF